MALEGERGEPVLAVPARLTKVAYAALVENDLVPRRWHPGGRHGSRTHKIVDCDDGGGGDAKCDVGRRMGLPLIASDEVVDLIESMLALRGRDGADRVVEDDDAIDPGGKDLPILEADPEATGGKVVDGDGSGNNRPTLDGQEQHDGHGNSYGGAQRKLGAKATAQIDDGEPLSSLRRILSTPGVELIYYREPVPFKNVPTPANFDSTVHPERAPPSFPRRIQRFLDDYVLEGGSLARSGHRRRGNGGNHRAPLFTFCELFAGIGGFGVALEAMGGRCVFASEIDESARRIYRANVAGVGDSNAMVLAGDIWDVDANDVPDHDLLVGGFPCQPFSSLGDQPGLADGKSCLRKRRVSRLEEGDASTAIAVTNRRNTKGDDDDSSDECAVEVDTGRGRGLLYTQIVRILEHRRPKAFLLENVPGLLRTDGGRAMRTIVEALEGAAGGYVVTHEVVNSRGLTAQSRKRLYIVGLLKETPCVGRRLEVTGSVAEGGDTTDRVGTGAEGAAAAFGSSPGTSSPLDDDDDDDDLTWPRFEFPFLPDLGLRAGDVLHSDDELPTLSLSEMGVPPISLQDGEQLEHNESDDKSPPNPLVVVPSDLFRLTDRQMRQLLSRCPKYWKPSKLAWDDVTCDTIDGHYGVSVGKGHSQLLPCRAPLHPRRFTPRECARIMGFGDDWFDLVVESPPPCTPEKHLDDIDDDDDGQQCGGRGGFRAVIKERYRLLGNSVCPPVVAGIAGAILDVILAPPPPFPPRVATADVAFAADGGPSEEVEGGDDDWDSRPIDGWTDVGLWTAVGLALEAIPAVRRGDVLDRVRRTLLASSSHSRSPPSPPVAV